MVQLNNEFKTVEQTKEMLEPGMVLEMLDVASVAHRGEIVTIGAYNEEYDEIEVTVKNAVTEHGTESTRKDWYVNRMSKIYTGEAKTSQEEAMIGNYKDTYFDDLAGHSTIRG